MAYYYMNEAEAASKWALPTLWVEHFSPREHAEMDPECEDPTGGYFYSCCIPGCLPDSEWYGPFDTEQEAVSDAREMWAD